MALQFVQHEHKNCDCLKKTLSKVAGVTNLVMGDSNVARMNFTGDWDELVSIEYAAWRIRCKANLIEPAMFAIDFTADKTTSTKGLMEALEKTPGVQKAFIEAGRLYVFSRMAEVDPRLYQQVIKDAGLRYVATRSHRLRSLSYEAWDGKSSLNVLKETLQKTTGVLRVDIDEKNKQVHVVLIRETSKDPQVVTAAEEACFTLYPGKAEEEDEPTPGVPAETSDKK